MWEALRNENLAQEQLIDVLESLLAMGFSVNESHGLHASRTVLYEALKYAGAPGPTALFLLAAGASADVRDDFGLSPLQHACKACHRDLIESIKALLQFEASASSTWRNGKHVYMRWHGMSSFPTPRRSKQYRPFKTQA